MKKLLDTPIIHAIYAKVGKYYEIGYRLIKYGFDLDKVSEDLDREIRKQEWKQKIGGEWKKISKELKQKTDK